MRHEALSSHLENLLHSKELGWILLCHPDKKISGFGVHMILDSYQIKKMSTLESVLKSCGFTSEFAGYVCMGGVTGKKKLQIQKYPDICGWSPRDKQFIIIIGQS